MISYLLLALGLSASIGVTGVLPQRVQTPTNTINLIDSGTNYAVYGDTFYGGPNTYVYNSNYLMQDYVTDGARSDNPFTYRYGDLTQQADDEITYRWFMFCYTPSTSVVPSIIVDNDYLSYNFPVTAEYIYGVIRTDENGYFSGFDFKYTSRFQNYDYTLFVSIEVYNGKYNISLPSVPIGYQNNTYHLDLDMENDFPNGTSEFDNTWDFTLVGVNKNTDSAIYQTGSTDGFDTGYQSGYNNGVIDGQNTGVSFLNLMASIADTPILMLRSLFNFDLFGINLLTVVMSLVTGLLVFYIVKKIVL